MINEERVRELFHIAKYDSTEEKKNRQMGQFYRSDYIWKELIKSFICGSIAFVLIVLLVIMYSVNDLIEEFGSFDLEHISVIFVILYLVFMIIYLIITYVIYYHRYTKGRKALKGLYEHVKKVNEMYDDEE